MSKLDRSDARNDVFDWALASKDIKEFKTRGTDMDTICNRVGDQDTILVDKEFRIKEIGMIC